MYLLFAAKDAAIEAMENDIELLNIITERIPTKDVWNIHQKAETTDTTVVGPTSVGIISPEKKKNGAYWEMNLKKSIKPVKWV